MGSRMFTIGSLVLASQPLQTIFGWKDLHDEFSPRPKAEHPLAVVAVVAVVFDIRKLLDLPPDLPADLDLRSARQPTYRESHRGRCQIPLPSGSSSMPCPTAAPQPLPELGNSTF